jgi:hypothetical protein
MARLDLMLMQLQLDGLAAGEGQPPAAGRRDRHP